jgi:ankyrin repeat protein
MVPEDGGVISLAAQQGAWDTVKALAGQPATDLNAQDKEGNTALMLAARDGRTDVIKVLVGRAEIDLNAHNKSGCTALMWAVRRAQSEAAKLLATLPGIDLKARNNYGLSALALAECLDSPSLVAFLRKLDTPKPSPERKIGITSTLALPPLGSPA